MVCQSKSCEVTSSLYAGCILLCLDAAGASAAADRSGLLPFQSMARPWGRSTAERRSDVTSWDDTGRKYPLASLAL